MDFFYSQYSFRSSRSTADLLTVVSDTIASAFNTSAGAANPGVGARGGRVGSHDLPSLFC